jgi:hypothetical protein
MNIVEDSRDKYSWSTDEDSPGKPLIVDRVEDQVQLYFYRATDTSLPIL